MPRTSMKEEEAESLEKFESDMTKLIIWEKTAQRLPSVIIKTKCHEREPVALQPIV